MITEGADEQRVLVPGQPIERGQLGRVVHDYDNILAVAAGAIELALRKLARGDIPEAERYLKRGLEATRRGAAFSASLTAFATGSDEAA